MIEIATLAGGCFWCLEAVFQRVRGVKSVRSGYMGGYVSQPQYRQVCDGNTGHAEAVQIEFDAAQVSFAELLEVFFAVHNPTTLNRQGHDVGTQYRSAIFYHSPQQLTQAQAALADAAQAWGLPIVTELVEATIFWPAEDEHHDYYNQHPDQPYCVAIVGPKVGKLIGHFPHLLNSGPIES
ncbi:peptide-methionine (S)-S-oxide reductase MsrA [Chitinibacter sp. FCG-7]|uniref:Peptide methionine sulfoxide reductase MsrA n=1 Tax=Chitinibacter mangrovi TaxID=3153927 RepID=A0AAU7FAC9_9NEIS